MELHEALARKVDAWREGGYSSDVPPLAEILDFAVENVDSHAPWPGSGQLRFLRAAQLRALETYWYLRVVGRTPSIPELYGRLFDTTSERLDALGLEAPVFKDLALNVGYEGLLHRVRTDDAFVKEHRLGVLRETLTLDYPSYILALAMGAGKTVLIGAIVATEFALALDHPEPPEGLQFIENALVFAPGTTIIESLRELSTIPFEKILPPRLFAPFAASLKITFTRDDERGIPVVAGSRFNLVVTNTEKIRIQAIPRRRQLSLASLLDHRDEEATERANLRLQAIASLPHLGVFSDEAHHTYGQSLDTQLKRVRQTVDYLGQATNVVAVINTTGTPYFERQPLRDVVVWYGLGQGIRDGILKDVANNIQSFAFEADQADEFVSHVVTDFLTAYGDHALPDGALIATVQRLPERAFAAPGGEEDWTIAQAIGHDASARAGLVIAASLAASDRWPAAAPTVAPGVPGPPDADRTALIRKIEQSQRLIAHAAHSIEGHETDPCPLDHPLVGRLRCGEWLLFAGVHDLMHLEQLHRLAGRIPTSARPPRVASSHRNST